jgi:membrane-associated protein
VLSAPHLLADYGLVGLGVVLFLETGLVVGLVLPGETLTILAGAYSRVDHGGAPHPQLALVIAAAALGAVCGGMVGYLLGRLVGAALLERPDGRIFKQHHLERTHRYFARFGARTIVIARFVPFVRTLANPVAGIATMPLKTFSLFNLLGGVLWAITVSLVGYELGSLLNVNANALAITLGILALSLLPLLLHRLRRPQPRV